MGCRAVLVLGIDVAAAESRHHVDEVELYHAGDVTPVFLFLALAALACNLQEHAGSQCHLVGAGSVVAVGKVALCPLIVIVTGSSIGRIRFGVRRADGIEEHVAGEVPEEVHHAIDAEVVAVALIRLFFFFGVFLFAIVGVFLFAIVIVGYFFRVSCICHLVQRHLAHTVDGVVGEVSLRGHTVLCALQHKAAAEHAHHVGTLDGVDEAPFVDVLHFRCLPIIFIGRAVLFENIIGRAVLFENISSCKQVADVIVYQFVACFIVVAVLVCAGLLAFIVELVVGLLARIECLKFCFGKRGLQSIEVSTVVGNVQFSVAIDEGQVAVAVDTADVLAADADEVEAVDVAHGCRGIAEHCGSIGIHTVATCRHVAAGKHGVIDGHASLVKIVPATVGLAQFVQVVLRNVVTLVVGGSVDGDAAAGHLTVRFNDHLAVLSHAFGNDTIFIIIAAAV